MPKTEKITNLKEDFIYSKSLQILFAWLGYKLLTSMTTTSVTQIKGASSSRSLDKVKYKGNKPNFVPCKSRFVSGLNTSPVKRPPSVNQYLHLVRIKKPCKFLDTLSNHGKYPGLRGIRDMYKDFFLMGNKLHTEEFHAWERGWFPMTTNYYITYTRLVQSCMLEVPYILWVEEEGTSTRYLVVCYSML